MSEDQNKKSRSANLANEEDRKAVREALEKAEKVYGHKEKENSEVDQLFDKAEKVAEENRNLKDTLKFVAEKELNKKMERLNVPEELREDFKANPDLLRGFEMAQKQNPTQKEVVSGSAPLNDAQYSGSSGQKGYASIPEMLDDLYAREKAGDKYAKQTLEKLVLKVARGTLRGQQQDVFEKPNEQETNKGSIVDKVLSPLTVEDETESELLKLGIKKKSPRGKMKHVDKEGNPK